MMLHILKKDILRKKSITIALLVFISLSALLAASGSNMITELFQSLNALFAKSGAPHFVQMHAGELEPSDIDRFAADSNLVKQHQTVEMVNVEGSKLILGGGLEPETNSVMDHYFVKQNASFDLLLNLKSEPVQVAQGEIAVPVYYMQHKDMRIGDTVKISGSEQDMTFTVVDFVRDVQMNPSIIHSKRFVVADTDLAKLKASAGEIEYLIEFQLTDLSRLNEFRNAYQASGLPKLGPVIDYHLFKTLNAITDGILAVVIILVSILLSIIALLCLRFTILAAIEEDYREIGVMKAIGIGQRDIKNIYLLKYVAIAALAAVIGYLASLLLGQLFTTNIMLYIGRAPSSILLSAIPPLAAFFIFLIVVGFGRLTLRRFNRISAVEALRSGNVGEAQLRRGFLSLHNRRWLHVPVFLGVRDVLSRFKMYRLLLVVFVICSFIIIVPVNFLSTVKSPDFHTYMGIERSDLRIDLQQSGQIASDYNRMLAYIEGDKDVERYSSFPVHQFKLVNSEGALENITVETGDFSTFPLPYLKGAPPSQNSEIALSYLNGKEMDKSVGDSVRLIVDGQEKEMTVSGIYQDVTNGGRTAKAAGHFSNESVLRYEVSINVKPHVDVGEKRKEYAAAFAPAKVTDLEGYLAQTLGNTIEQLKLVTVLAVVIALLIAVLITSLFLKMAVAKDYTQIAIMKSIGFSLKHIRLQYVTRALLVLGVGIAAGTVISNTIGQSIAGIFMSFMGAPTIRFVIDPVQAYMVYPVLLMLAVTAAVLMSIVSIKRANIAEMNAE